MRFTQAFLAGIALATVAAPSFAQSASLDSPSQRAPQRQVTFDLSLAGLGVGFAVRNSSNVSVGASIGIGGNWWNYMVLGGRHFAEADGLSYQSKDGSTDKSLFEVGHASLFVRRHFSGGRQLDFGLKGSGFLHSDSSDDDPGGGTFIGLNVTGTWLHWRKLGLGSEINVGRYSEGRPELGVNVAPLLVRLSIP